MNGPQAAAAVHQNNQTFMVGNYSPTSTTCSPGKQRAYSFSEVLILALINPKYDTSMYKTIATNVWFMSFGKSVE